MTLDNATTSAYSLVTVVAADRKGLVYDLMRTLKDIHLRVAYAKVGGARCSVLQEVVFPSVLQARLTVACIVWQPDLTLCRGGAQNLLHCIKKYYCATYPLPAASPAT